MLPKGFALHVPIYIQIVEAFHRALARGDLNPEDRAPAVRELAAQLVVNPNTVQRAYQELERQGLLVTRRGLGTFVTEKPEVIQESRRHLAEAAARKYLGEMAELGFSAERAAAFLSDTHAAAAPTEPEGDE